MFTPQSQLMVWENSGVNQSTVAVADFVAQLIVNANPYARLTGNKGFYLCFAIFGLGFRVELSKHALCMRTWASEGCVRKCLACRHSLRYVYTGHCLETLV